jgi:lysozyme
MDLITLKESIRKHEGYRRFPYLDSEALLTVGTGHLLHHTEIPRGLQTLGQLYDWMTDPARHAQWLVEDVNQAISIATTWLGPKFTQLTDTRQRVIAEMAFQLGDGLYGFENMKAAILDDNHDRAADEGLRSRWSQQTPTRARELMALYRVGAA